MVRGFARSVRKLVAQVAIVCVALSGMPAVASAQQSKRLPSIKQMQQLVQEIERKGVLDSERMNAVRILLAIATAPNARAQGALIRQLPVSIVWNQHADGRLVQEFISRGRVRLSVVHRAAREQDGDVQSSGPSVPEDSELCFEDEEPPCATDEEMDELGMLIAYSQGEMETIQVEVEQDMMLIACCNLSEQAIQSGPSVMSAFQCVAEGFAATGAAITGVSTSMAAGMKHQAARAAGKALSVASKTMWGLAILGAALLTVAAYNVYKSCREGGGVRPDSWDVDHWFEPICVA